MKFVALALAFFLAAGCQAEVQQADIPSHYEHIRAIVVTSLNQIKEAVHRAIDHLDDAEFKDYKARLNKALEIIENFITYTAESLAPIRGGIGPQLVEFVFDSHKKLSHDLQELRKELDPKYQELQVVVKKHLEEYRSLTEPALKEYTSKNQQVVDEFKAKFEPVFKQLQEKLKVNVEETKSKLTPIVEIIRNKLTTVIEELRTIYGPHVQEYKEQIEAVQADLRHKYETGKLQDNLKKLADELRPKVTDIFETVAKYFKS
ncbi:Apolipoprotein A-I-2 [Bagarius yarrelli]|uniref:Apolipoprotein A-I-2 n=1 Tax=Bagarius yarrelli TaxID=175774 RepID=A0A556UY62_BAGYA|nr:Apolipoprotein A-I-2 [Bagarius yarrelli]